MKIIAVSAHPDDLEISCSGTLLKYQQAGAHIISVITVKPSAEINVNRDQQKVRTEMLNSYGISQFELRILDTDLHSNGRPNLVCDNNTMTELANLLESCDLAILPNRSDHHQDHRHTFNLAFPLVKKMAKEIWMAHSWPYCHGNDSVPNLFVDITQQWTNKSLLLDCYGSYINDDIKQKISVTNQYWGQANGTELCEAFTLINRYDR